MTANAFPPTPRRTWFTNLAGAAAILLGGIGSLFSAFVLLLAIGKPYANSATDPLGIFLIFILPPGTLLAASADCAGSSREGCGRSHRLRAPGELLGGA
jgi:hypothetical protein